MNPNSLLALKVITPEGIIFEIENLTSINVPLADGSPIGIRPGHTPLIAETVQGMLVFRSGQNKESIHLHAGVLDIRNDNVTILTAGKVEENLAEVAEPLETEYDRLMQTLVKKLSPDQELEIE